MGFECITYENKDSIAYITLNRPEKLNALNGQLLSEFREIIQVIEVDPDVRVVILTGAGRAFSAGFDIERSSDDSSTEEITPEKWREHLQTFVDTFMMVWNLGKPVIAAVNGYALGGACELVQICDIKIASEHAILGEPEIRAGVGPPLLITPFSTNLAMAKELLLTGDTVDAYEAARIGLVGRVVKHDDLIFECERIARKICLLPQIGVKLSKISVNRALEYMGLDAGTPIQDIAIDRVFIGSCTNSRIEDLRAAARIAKDKKVDENVYAMVVPGSNAIKRQAEEEGIDIILKDAGFDWREAGCSMCLGMNPDILDPGERCASTSNRNFEGRQGKGGRTHLVSPEMAAAAAIKGHFVDIRNWS